MLHHPAGLHHQLELVGWVIDILVVVFFLGCGMRRGKTIQFAQQHQHAAAPFHPPELTAAHSMDETAIIGVVGGDERVLVTLIGDALLRPSTMIGSVASSYFIPLP